MNKNTSFRVKNKNNRKLFVWFADQVYAMGRLFEYSTEGPFEGKLHRVMAIAHNLRNTSPNIAKTYGMAEGVPACLEGLEKVLLEVERIAISGQVERSRKEECKYQLESLAWRLAEIWQKEHDGTKERQATLAIYV